MGLPRPEQLLCLRDSTLAAVITSQSARWPSYSTENPIWGLIRIVMAQQISTHVACRLAERVRNAYPQLTSPSPAYVPDTGCLQEMGLPRRRAQCCVTLVERSDDILSKVRHGHTWEEALAGIKGIGPWTISVFRIMVLRCPDELPVNDVGLQRAIVNIYGNATIQHLGEMWRPYRSVACWYLWRTLGNEQLG